MLLQIDVVHDCFDQVESCRISGRTTQPLNLTLLLMVSATIADADGTEKIECFGIERLEWLSRFADFPNGPPFHDTIGRVLSPSEHYHAGSSTGRELYEGGREEVTQPRARQKSGNGSSHEVELATYRVAKDPQQLQKQVVQVIAVDGPRKASLHLAGRARPDEALIFSLPLYQKKGAGQSVVGYRRRMKVTARLSLYFHSGNSH